MHEHVGQRRTSNRLMPRSNPWRTVGRRRGRVSLPRNARAQPEAISAAASVTLSGDDLDALEATLAVYSAVGKHRHDLAHEIYGVSEQLPDAVLWTEPSKHAHFLITIQQGDKAGWHRTRPHARMKADLFIYREKDLAESYKLITETWDGGPARATRLARTADVTPRHSRLSRTLHRNGIAIILRTSKAARA